jgi:hypothetical protein
VVFGFKEAESEKKSENLVKIRDFPPPQKSAKLLGCVYQNVIKTRQNQPLVGESGVKWSL